MRNVRVRLRCTRRRWGKRTRAACWRRTSRAHPWSKCRYTLRANSRWRGQEREAPSPLAQARMRCFSHLCTLSSCCSFAPAFSSHDLNQTVESKNAPAYSKEEASAICTLFLAASASIARIPASMSIATTKRQTNALTLAIFLKLQITKISFMKKVKKKKGKKSYSWDLSEGVTQASLTWGYSVSPSRATVKG